MRAVTGAAAAAAASASTMSQVLAQTANSSKGAVNIVYLHSHDSGRYFKPYGHDVPTPNLTRLARDGVLFRQMHCAAPTCSPSRAAMLTGQTAHNSGMLGLTHRGWALKDYGQHIIHTLKPHGYHTVLAGLQHIAAESSLIGFDEVLPHRSTSAADVAPVAAEFISKHAKRPFFLDAGFFETHRPFAPPVPGASAYIQPPFPMPDVPATRLDMAGYHSSASVMDGGIGLILNALDAAGLASNTLVISTTDHGITFPNMKCDLRDAGTGVSMILRGPGIFAGPKVCDAMLTHLDLFPTLCEYLGIPKPAWLQGKSFLPILSGQQSTLHEAVFAEVNFHAAYEPKRSVRTERYKYIRRFSDRSTAVLPNCDEGLSKSYWLKKGWATQPLISDANHEELYDLVFDPVEHTNLASHPAMATELASMRKRLAEWMKATSDPLLNGPIIPPPGVITDDPNAVSTSQKAGAQAN